MQRLAKLVPKRFPHPQNNSDNNSIHDLNHQMFLFHIEGHFEQPEIMSDHLKAKLVQFGVPQSTLQKFLVKGADYV